MPALKISPTNSQLLRNTSDDNTANVNIGFICFWYSI